MTYDVIITAISCDRSRKTDVFRASRITEKHLEEIFEHVLPKYNPIAHEITIVANITREEAENERNRIYKTS